MSLLLILNIFIPFSSVSIVALEWVKVLWGAISCVNIITQGLKWADFLNSKIFKYLAASLYSTYFSLKSFCFFQPSCSNWEYCKLGIKNCFSFLLTFYYQLILRKGIFGTSASLIPYFFYMSYNYVALENIYYFNKLFPFFLVWLLYAKTHTKTLTQVVKRSLSKVKPSQSTKVKTGSSDL